MKTRELSVIYKAYFIYEVLHDSCHPEILRLLFMVETMLICLSLWFGFSPSRLCNESRLAEELRGRMWFWCTLWASFTTDFREFSLSCNMMSLLAVVKWGLFYFSSRCFMLYGGHMTFFLEVMSSINFLLCLYILSKYRQSFFSMVLHSKSTRLLAQLALQLKNYIRILRHRISVAENTSFIWPFGGQCIVPLTIW